MEKTSLEITDKTKGYLFAMCYGTIDFAVIKVDENLRTVIRAGWKSLKKPGSEDDQDKYIDIKCQFDLLEIIDSHPDLHKEIYEQCNIYNMAYIEMEDGKYKELKDHYEVSGNYTDKVIHVEYDHFWLRAYQGNEKFHIDDYEESLLGPLNLLLGNDFPGWFERFEEVVDAKETEILDK